MDFLDAKGAVIKTFTSNQDPTVAVDSVRSDSVRRVRADSLRRAGVKEDSTQRTEARSEEAPADDTPRRAPPPPRVSNKAGLNTFSWNLRYPDAVTFQNLIMWAAGTQGPVAVPGTYSVRMTVAGQPAQTQRFTVVKDPRSTVTQTALEEQFAFLVAVRDKTSEANNAVRKIRNVKLQLNDRVSKMPAAQKAAFKAKADAFASQLSAVEAEIYQVKNQSGQDPLNYPIKLNNKIAALSGVASSADARPTDQTRVVFKILSAQLDAQLARLTTAMQGLSSINADLKTAGLQEIVPSTDEPKNVGPTSARGDDDNDRDSTT
jgi:hypothetical protein